MQPFPPAPGPPRRPHNSSPATATTRSAAVVGEGSSRSDDRAESQSQGQTPGGTAQAKRRKHRGGKKKRNRRQSFAAPSDDGSAIASMLGDHTADDSPSRPPANLQPQQFYRLTRGNMSNSSLDSDTLLDHRYVLASLGSSLPRRVRVSDSCFSLECAEFESLTFLSTEISLQ